MNSNVTLDMGLQRSVLRFLEIAPEDAPGLDLLERLVSAYTRRVPWESVFRIVKRSRTKDVMKCPRWPEEFWSDAVDKGGGGTCFESNFALMALLNSLGYEGYLTINDMEESIGCHAAIVLKIEEGLWLADVGLPVYVPLPLNASEATSSTSQFHTYTVTPQSSGIYQVDRDRHPKPYCYTLIDKPIPDRYFRQAIVDDYGPEGYFLDRAIITKVIADEFWRFGTHERPYRMERFRDGIKEIFMLPEDERRTAEALSRRFSMDEEMIYTGLKLTKRL
jgi:arylamine N-acetyltransferase